MSSPFLVQAMVRELVRPGPCLVFQLSKRQLHNILCGFWLAGIEWALLPRFDSDGLFFLVFVPPSFNLSSKKGEKNKKERERRANVIWKRRGKKMVITNNDTTREKPRIFPYRKMNRTREWGEKLLLEIHTRDRTKNLNSTLRAYSRHGTPGGIGRSDGGRGKEELGTRSG